MRILAALALSATIAVTADARGAPEPRTFAGPDAEQRHCVFVEKCRPCMVERVVDGDTIELSCSTPSQWDRLTLRLAGIDAPEKGTAAKCDQERRLAASATIHLAAKLPSGTWLDVISMGKDRHGRTIGVARLDDRDIGADLVWAGHAKPWAINTPRPTWCDTTTGR